MHQEIMDSFSRQNYFIGLAPKSIEQKDLDAKDRVVSKRDFGPNDQGTIL